MKSDFQFLAGSNYVQQTTIGINVSLCLWLGALWINNIRPAAKKINVRRNEQELLSRNTILQLSILPPKATPSPQTSIAKISKFYLRGSTSKGKEGR